MISVIVCTHNRSDLLREMFASFGQLALPSELQWELVVVDNNSSDDTRSAVEAFEKEFPGNVRYLFEPQPGKSFALNAGVEAARGDILAFTDDDVTLHQDWLLELAKAFEDGNCMAVGGRIFPVWPSAKPRWFFEQGPITLTGVVVQYDLGDQPRAVSKNCVPIGANMAFRKTAFAKYGLFRTDLGPCGTVLRRGEDVELFARVLAGEERVVYAPKAIVYHPVVEERTRKPYYRSWFYNLGKDRIRQEGLPRQAIRYFGVPRFLYREMAENFVRWVAATNPKRRFSYQLQMCAAAGKVVESRRLHRALP